MSTDIERQLAAGMRDRVGGVTLTTDVLGEATRRHRRRVAKRRTAYTAGVLGLAAGVALAVAVGTRPDARPGAVTAAGSASLRLTAAVAASDTVSYKLKITSGPQPGSDAWGTSQGAYDPATSSGYLDSRQPDNSATYYQRLIGGELYLGSTGTAKWKQERGDGHFEWGDALGGASAASADPQALFQALEANDATITQTGADAYHFTVTIPVGIPVGTVTRTLVGDVTLNADRRIAKVSYVSTDRGLKKGIAVSSTSVFTVELSDYGVAVHVDRPTDVVVVQ